MNLPREALEDFYSIAESSYNKLKAEEDTEVIVHYSGDLNFGFANALTSRVEKILEEKIESKKAKRRFFSVFIEAIQNIRLHSEIDESEHIHSIVTVFTQKGQLKARFANIVEKSKAEKLRKRYEELNQLSPEVLKERYMDVMMNGAISDKGGAGLGIITMIMRSKNPSLVFITELNSEYDIFSHMLSVDLD